MCPNAVLCFELLLVCIGHIADQSATIFVCEFGIIEISSLEHSVSRQCHIAGIFVHRYYTILEGEDEDTKLMRGHLQRAGFSSLLRGRN